MQVCVTEFVSTVLVASLCCVVKGKAKGIVYSC